MSLYFYLKDENIEAGLTL